MAHEIRNPTAYENAKHARIQHNAWKRRRRELDAAITGDGPVFRAWLLSFPPDSAYAAFEAQRVADGCTYVDRDRYGDECALHGFECPAHKVLHDAIDSFRRAYGYVPSFLLDAIDRWGGLTEKQLELARKIWAERQEKAAGREAEREAERATAQAWTAGRQVVEGVVVSVKSVENQFGVALKMTLKRDDGSRLFCTVPSTLCGQGLRGQRVRFTVTVEPKAEEPTFAFGSRPAKGEILTPVEA